MGAYWGSRTFPQVTLGERGQRPYDHVIRVASQSHSERWFQRTGWRRRDRSFVLIDESCLLPTAKTYITPKPGPEESHLAFMSQEEATMFKKMLVLALLLPGVGGCIWRGDHGRGQDEHGRDHQDRGRQEEHRDHRQAAVIEPEHVHGAECGHVLLGCFWFNVE
jgi:hypothetical protein